MQIFARVDGVANGLPVEGDWVWVRAVDQQATQLLSAGCADSGEDDYLSLDAIMDVMIAPFTGDEGVIALLAVCSRSGVLATGTRGLHGP